LPYSDRAHAEPSGHRRRGTFARLDETLRLIHTTTRNCMPSEIGEEVDADAVEDDDLEELSDEAVLDDELEEDLDDDDDDVVDPTEDELVLEVPVGDVAAVVAAPAAEPEEAASEDDDDEEDDDDVEASLDVILKERLVVADDEDEDEEETPDAEDRADGTLRVLPKQPGEFVCQSCFLVKSELQLADGQRMLCRDCV
jgi:hypothetical protein